MCAVSQAYDLVAGSQGLTMSRFASHKESHRQFPTLAEHQPNGKSLKGTVCRSFILTFGVAQSLAQPHLSILCLCMGLLLSILACSVLYPSHQLSP